MKSSSPVLCPDCGQATASGELTCLEQRDRLLERDFSEPVRFWRFHRLAVDAYCLQHPAYVASAKSLAAHLCGACIAFEYGNDEGLLRALQQWLSTNPALIKPLLPMTRGELTVSHVFGIDDPVMYGEAVDRWARSAWEAHHLLHQTARQWIAAASAAR